MEVADRIAVMNHGRIEQVGAPRELYEQPANDVRDGLPRPGHRASASPRAPARPSSRARAAPTDASEARSSRVVHLGFEVRVELVLADGGRAARPAHPRRGRAARAGDRRHRVGRAGRPQAPALALDRASAQRVVQAARVAGQPLDVVGQRSRGDVGERDVLEHAAQVRAHARSTRAAAPRPHPGSRGPPARWPRTRGERPLDGADDVGDRDLVRRTGQPVAAVRPALAGTMPALAQVGEDVLQELQRDVLRRGDRLALDGLRPAARRARPRRGPRSRPWRRCASARIIADRAARSLRRSGYPSPSPRAAPSTRLKSGCGRIPKKSVAAPQSSAAFWTSR